MRRKLLAVLATVPFATLGATAVPAAAAGTVSLSTGNVLLTAGAHSYLTVTVDFGQCMDSALVDIESATPGGYDYKSIGRDQDGRFSVRFALSNTDTTGRWYVSIDGATCDYTDYYDQDDIKSFYVRRNSGFTGFNAAPEPVKKGKAITVTGYLRRLDPWGGKYVGYTGTTVRIDLKPSGSSTWSSKGTTKTGSGGKFTRKFTASKDGAWRAVFAGTPYHAAEYGPGDYVDVR